MQAESPYSSEGFSELCNVLGEAACTKLGFYVIPDELLLSVVIPVYNEQDTLLELIDAVRAVPVRKELILVDDGSQDDSRKLLRELEQKGMAPE